MKELNLKKKEKENQEPSCRIRGQSPERSHHCLCFPHRWTWGGELSPAQDSQAPPYVTRPQGWKCVLNLMRAALEVAFPEEFVTILPPAVSFIALRIYCLHGSRNAELMFKTGASVWPRMLLKCVALKREVCDSSITLWGSDCLSVVPAMGTPMGNEWRPDLWGQSGWPRANTNTIYH